MDIVPSLLEKIQADYQTGVENSEVIKRISQKVSEGKADYIDANDYAAELAKILARVYAEYLTDENLPDGTMYFNIADRVLRPTMETAQKAVIEVCSEIQNDLNAKGGLGLKAVKADLDEDRIDGIIDKISGEDE